MDQQHVARQARRRGHLLLEEGEDVGRLALIEVGHVLRECHRLLEADRREAAVGLRGGLDDGALEVAAAVAGDVVPEHFDTVLRDREGVVAALLEIRQAVAVVDRLHVQRALPDRLVDLGRQGHRAMGLVHRDPVGFRVALEHRQLAVGELVLVLLDVLRGDGEQRLLVGKGIGKEALAIDLAGAGREAAGPGRDAAVGVAFLLRADGGQAAAELGGLVGRNRRRHRTGQQAEGQRPGGQESCCFHASLSLFVSAKAAAPRGGGPQKFTPKLTARKSRSLIGL